MVADSGGLIGRQRRQFIVTVHTLLSSHVD